ncbi:MAG TPA: hypothetical protein VF762_23345 [Blastocatellia bacterium]|jgi:hypothetical protein
MSKSALAVVRRDDAVQVMTFDETLTLGKVLAESGFFKDAKSQSQAVAKILAGREMGFGPMASMAGIHIIEGKPSISGLLIASAIKSSGKYDYRIQVHNLDVCTLLVFEGAEQVGVVSFSAEDAKRAKLTDGPNKHTWEKYREDMLFWRAISRAARRYCPDIFKGPVYTPDELGAVLDTQTGEYVPTATTEKLLANTKPAPTANPAQLSTIDRLKAEIAESISTLRLGGHESFRNDGGRQRERILEHVRGVALDRGWDIATLNSLSDLNEQHLGEYAGVLEGEIALLKETRAEIAYDIGI